MCAGALFPSVLPADFGGTALSCARKLPTSATRKINDVCVARVAHVAQNRSQIAIPVQGLYRSSCCRVRTTDDLNDPEHVSCMGVLDLSVPSINYNIAVTILAALGLSVIDRLGSRFFLTFRGTSCHRHRLTRATVVVEVHHFFSGSPHSIEEV